VTDDPKEKRERASAKVISQIEADARAVREKTARLRALRLAQEAGNTSAGGTADKRAAVKKTPRKSGGKAVPLSEWLSAQEKEGRRN
jgi:hypothetical protein